MVLPDFNMTNRDELAQRVPSFAITDAKSVWDHLVSTNPTAGVVDNRSALDFIICHESIQKRKTDLRWTPGVFQLADALRKEEPEGLDALRAAIVSGKYRLDDEAAMLKKIAAEKLRRQQRSKERAETNKAKANSQKKEYADDYPSLQEG